MKMISKVAGFCLILGLVEGQSSSCADLAPTVSFHPISKADRCVGPDLNLSACSSKATFLCRKEEGVYKTDSFEIKRLDGDSIALQLKVNGKCLTLVNSEFKLRSCDEKKRNQLFTSGAAFSEPEPKLRFPNEFKPEHLGSYRPYWDQEGRPFTPEPPQCKAIHLEHMGRHGDRHASLKKQFTDPIRIMEYAADSGSLTPEGELLLKWAQELEESTEFIPERQLTPQGFTVAYEIGSRLVDNFPSVFLPSEGNSGKNLKINLKATPTKRTEQTMDFYVRGMIDQGVDADRMNTETADHCSQRFISYRAFDTCKHAKDHFGNLTDFDPWMDYVVKSLDGPEGPAERFHQLAFKPGFQPAGAERAKRDWVKDWWEYVCMFQANVNGSEMGKLCSVFTEEDGEILSYIDDLKTFLSLGRTPNFPMAEMLGCGIINEFLEGLEEAVESYTAALRNPALNDQDRVVANLRFAHKESLAPVLGALWISAEDPFIYLNGDSKMRQYRGDRLLMMGCNLQFVLYACIEESSTPLYGSSARAPKFKVKILLNEVERVLPGCDELYCDLEKVLTILKRNSCDSELHEQMCKGQLIDSCELAKYAPYANFGDKR
mmetsp:Transcript_37321/g.73393  ORF Transcript_37321/g.73393 Transcript_37321/m.73393 type:complete len:603 (-) Transcript_37321:53-1861(-)